jgi:hypothetical protein
MKVSLYPRLVLLASLLGFSSCSSLSAVFQQQETSSLNQVDTLLGAVEQVHLQCEVSKKQSMEALDALHKLVAPGFQGDAILVHEALLQEVENSKDQAAALRAELDPMINAALAVANKWNEDLNAYATDRMRDLSRERLEVTNQLYVDVHMSLVAGADLYDQYNQGMNDHALYLGNDLNATSVAAIQQELLMVTEIAQELDTKLAICMEACQVYVRENALRGQLTMQVAPEPVPVAGLRPGLSSGN